MWHLLRLLLGLLITAVSLAAQPSRLVSLDGEWQFALDPLRKGTQYGWMTPPFGSQSWDKVQVPHSWPADKRYPYIGTAWYRRTFLSPVHAQGERVMLEFGAAFARAHVWLNGTHLGSHEGGYTPFDFDVTGQIAEGVNSLAVEVDSSWTTTTLPGARPDSAPESQVYPYFPWGGLIRDVQLEILPVVYIANARIIADPDLATGAAHLRVTAWVRNASPEARDVVLAVDTGARASALIEAGQVGTVSFEQTVPADRVRLWDFDHPNVSSLTLKLNTGHERTFTYGVRKIEVHETELLLNGHPFRLGGANRAGDHPRFGLVEPREVVERDGQLLKEAGLDMARLQHYAIPPALLDWADRNGLLIIAEAAQWGFRPEQLDNPDLHADFQRQHREMIERDWNHPSIIAWSVGNEYASDTPPGVRWTREMAAYTRSLDPSRPVTFAGYRADRTSVPPEQEGSAWIDFVMINVYGKPDEIGARLDRVHSRYPHKPVLVSEYGIRSDQVKSEDERIAWFSAMLAVFRARPWIAGASVWSFNDYRSLYPGTNPSGFRPWGLVDEERRPRGAYALLVREQRPLLWVAGRRDGNRLRITLKNRDDFPCYRLTGARLELDWGAQKQSVTLPNLEPGVVFENSLEIPARATRLHIVARRAGGWIALEHEVAIE